MFLPDTHGSSITPFSGCAGDGVLFFIRLRRLEDIMRMRPLQLTEAQRAYFLIGHGRSSASEGGGTQCRGTKKLRLGYHLPPCVFRASAAAVLSARWESGGSCTAFAN
ncbi:hypothetical protein GCK32_002022 [Trichostrongylus colubriformis]|uniref:Uncharacterized protein n=1 Tax=Trichostrongylus colubriformis TaxID=6319 RepID=A0AAN8IDT3_TRICO